jgi:serine/threonine protein kinase
MESSLAEVQAVVVETHAAVLDIQGELSRQGKQNQDVYAAVMDMQKRFDLMRTDVRPRDSLSIRSDAERQMIKEVIARYRGLPEDRRKQMPALLNAVGKLELAAGAFQAAEKDFAAVATLVEDPAARAEAHLNAYRAALESRDWDRALRELVAAIKLDAKRFSPFPIGKFIPQRILGAGGFGVVFLCKHRYMNTPVVVKTLIDDDLDRRVDQLFTEAQVLRSLDHPNIVRLQDCAYTDATAKSRPYMVMDYFEGVTLEDYVHKHGQMNPQDWVSMARQMAKALQAAHSKNVLHRDVKPANLLVRKQGEGDFRTLMIDFGLAMNQQAMKATSRRSNTLAGASIAGTLDYAAPEQMGKLPGYDVGPASDVYGFAKTCCYALFGTPSPVLKHWQSVPESLADLLSRCLGEKPTERPVNFDVILRCLDRLSLDEMGGNGRADENDGVAVAIPVGPQPVRAVPVAAVPVRANRFHDDGDDYRPTKQGMNGPMKMLVAGVALWIWGLAALGLLMAVGLVIFLMSMGGKGKSTDPNNANNTTTANSGSGSTFVTGFSKTDPDDRKTYLTNLPSSVTTNFPGGWKFGTSGSVGDMSNTRIRWNGKTSPRGLGMHAPPTGAVSAFYALQPSTYDEFVSLVGVDDGSNFPLTGEVVFQAIDDGGKVLWASDGIKAKNQFQECRVSVRNVRKLELRVNAPSSGSYVGANAVWIEPHFVRLFGVSAPETTQKDPVTKKDPFSTDPPGASDPDKTFLSDLQEFGFDGAPFGWSFGKNGQQGDIFKTPITANGVQAKKGIGLHPPENGVAKVKYKLPASSRVFEGKVGISEDRDSGAEDDIFFLVIGDDKLLWKSKPVRTKGEFQPFQIPVDGVKVLELRVDATSTERAAKNAHAVWIDPCVTRTGSAAPVTSTPGSGDVPAAAAKIPWKGNKCFLADMEELEVKHAEWPFLKNGRTGKNGELPILVSGQLATKGLSTHPQDKKPVRVKYALNKEAALFEGLAAIPDNGGDVFGDKPIVFEVVGDEVTLMRKDIMKKGVPEKFRLEIKGVDVLELRVSCGFFSQPGVWVNPYILKDGSSDSGTGSGAWTAADPKTVQDLKVRELGNGAAVLALVWAADGKCFYVGEAGGIVRRIDAETFKETATADLRGTVKGLSLSKAGLLASFETPLLDLVVLDPTTLAPITGKRGALTDSMRVTGSSNLNVAFTEVKPGVPEFTPRIRVVDLAKFGFIGPIIPTADKNVREKGYNERMLLPSGGLGATTAGYTVTPDGKWMFGYNDKCEIIRWTVAGTGALTYAASSPALALTAKNAQIVCSPDGKYVALLMPDGNKNPAGELGSIDEYSTYVFDGSNLKKPLFSVQQGKSPTAMAFDKDGVVYSNNTAYALVRFSAKGQQEKTYSLSGGSTRMIVTSPEGKKLLVLTDKKLYHAEPAATGKE